MLRELPPGNLIAYPGTHSDGLSDSALNLNAAAQRVAFIFAAPKAGQLDSFDFLTGTVLQATNGVRCSFRAVDLTTGFPVTGNLSTKTLGGIVSNTWFTPGSFDVPVTVARGDLVAAVIQILTFVAGDNIDIRYGTGIIGFQNFPFLARNDGTNWGTIRGTANLAIRYTDGTFAHVPGNIALKTQANNVAINNGSSPNEIGNLFRLKFPLRCSGAYFLWAIGAGAGSYRIRIYDRANVNLVGTAENNPALVAGAGYFAVTWPAVALKANVDYRLIVKPTTPTNVGARRYQFQSSALRAVSQWGSSWRRTERSLNGPWIDTDTEIVPMGLLVSGFWEPDA
jgi:hypothetical protein